MKTIEEMKRELSAVEVRKPDDIQNTLNINKNALFNQIKENIARRGFLTRQDVIKIAAYNQIHYWDLRKILLELGLKNEVKWAQKKAQRVWIRG